MAKLLMIYASMSGNTEDMAKEIEAGIRSKKESVDVLEAFETDASAMEAYEGILIGTYTWGDGDLPDELLDFYEDMKQLDLTGKKAAVFGSFDSSYGDDGIAVDQMRDALQRQGAEIVQEELKVELSPTPDDRALCREFGERFAENWHAVKKL
ncbi:MAG TPA: flavodoxin [Bacillales bacterium]|nr:flavodoxin [Bacillales bacterium]